MKLIYNLSAALLMLPAFASGAECEYCLADIHARNGMFGSGKAETYNVAVVIDNPYLTGATIKGIRVPLAESEYLQPESGWISSELKLEVIDGVKTNAPDITSQSGRITDGWFEVTFDSPFRYDGSPIYVGYTFKVLEVSDNTRTPVAGVDKAERGSFWYFADKSCAKWLDNSERKEFSSLMRVVLESDFDDVSVSMKLNDEVDLSSEDSKRFDVDAEIVSYGMEEITSIEYSWDIDGIRGNNIVNFDTAPDTQFAYPFSITLPVAENIEAGFYNMTVSIDRINGKENPNKEEAANMRVNVISEYYKRRPMMEEYTGLWCGWCPRGFAGMERMNNLYGEEFIALSFHSDDAMAVMETSSMPNGVGGAPDAWFDRELQADPYHGTSGKGFGLEKDWLARKGMDVIGDITLSASWDDESHTNITVKSECVFAKPIYENYRVGYALLADGLTNERWRQNNSYTGMEEYSDIEEMEKFINGDSPVKGLVFDDIVISGKDIMGIEGSLPNPVNPLERIAGDYSFEAAEAINLKGESLIQDPSKLRVVGFILDEKGRVVNCNVCKVDEPSAVSSIITEEIVTVKYYDLTGSRVTPGYKGIAIRHTTYSDGSTKSEKVVF